MMPIRETCSMSSYNQECDTRATACSFASGKSCNNTPRYRFGRGPTVTPEKKQLSRLCEHRFPIRSTIAGLATVPSKTTVLFSGSVTVQLSEIDFDWTSGEVLAST